MSYDISNQVQNRRATAEMRVQVELDDKKRAEFMTALNKKMFHCDWKLTEFESAFLASWSGSPKSKPFWTPKRRDVADELKRKYS